MSDLNPDRHTHTSMWARIAFAAYDTIVTAVVWLVLTPLVVVQVARRRVRYDDLLERLGAVPPTPRQAPRVVVHAVSGGEAMAAGSFIEALGREQPNWSVAFTCGTRDGRRVGEQLQQCMPSIESVSYLPWDRSKTVTAWVRAVQPHAVVVIETEIWPGLFRACEQIGVPLSIVSGRVYPRDIARYRLVRGVMCAVLRVPFLIAARTIADRDAFITIGAPAHRVVVGGDLKFDAAISALGRDVPAALESLRRRDCAVVLGGSTHPTEEDALLDAFARLREQHARLRLILAPRHIARAAHIAATARRRQHRVALSSDESAASAIWDVMVVDSFGALAPLYTLADVVFVGGTLVPHGGHNVLEPAAAARAIIVGPHVTHVREAVEAMDKADAIVRLQTSTADAVTDAIATLLSDTARRDTLGRNAAVYVSAYTGAAHQAVQALTSEVARRAGVSEGDPSRARQEMPRPAASAAAWSTATATPPRDRTRLSR